MSREDREAALCNASDFCDEGVLSRSRAVSVVFGWGGPRYTCRFHHAAGGAIDIGRDINRFSLRQNISSCATVPE